MTPLTGCQNGSLTKRSRMSGPLSGWVIGRGRE